jgi:hypothetical protein
MIGTHESKEHKVSFYILFITNEMCYKHISTCPYARNCWTLHKYIFMRFLFGINTDIQAQNDNFGRYWAIRAVTLIKYLNTFLSTLCALNFFDFFSRF